MANTMLFVFSDVYELVLWSSEDVSALEMFFLNKEGVFLLVNSEMCYKYTNISVGNWLSRLFYGTLFIHVISMLALTQCIISVSHSLLMLICFIFYLRIISVSL